MQSIPKNETCRDQNLKVRDKMTEMAAFGSAFLKCVKELCWLHDCLQFWWIWLCQPIANPCFNKQTKTARLVSSYLKSHYSEVEMEGSQIWGQCGLCRQTLTYSFSQTSDLKSISRPHRIGDTWHPKVVLWPPHISQGTIHSTPVTIHLHT